MAFTTTFIINLRIINLRNLAYIWGMIANSIQRGIVVATVVVVCVIVVVVLTILKSFYSNRIK